MRPVAEIGKQFLQNRLLAGSFLWKLPAGSDAVLTFDDGPNPDYTPRVLELLARHDVKATFFVVGTAIAANPQLLRDIVAAGHSIGSHTQTHRELPTLTRVELEEELGSCRRLIADTVGVDTHLLRPPRGRVNVTSLFRARALGYCIVHWSKTYSDYRRDGRDPLIARIRSSGLGPRDITLFHDNNPFTVEALDVLLPEWHAAGRTFASL